MNLKRIERATRSIEWAAFIAGYYVIHNLWIQPDPTLGVDEWAIVFVTISIGLYLIDVCTNGGVTELHNQLMDLFGQSNNSA